MSRLLYFFVNVIWWPFAAPRRDQPREIDEAISRVWRDFCDGLSDEEEAGKRDAELRQKQPKRDTVG